MLKPNDIQAIINDISSIYSGVELSCIKSITKHLGAGKRLTSIDVWRLEKLQSVGALRKELVKEISRETQKAMKDIQAEIITALKRSNTNDIKAFKKALETSKGFEEMLDPAFKRVVNQSLAKVRDALNLTGTQALVSGEKTFIASVNRAYLDVTTGTSSLYDAITNACMQIGNGGIKVEYASGYTTSLDASIKRDIVTTINQQGAELTLQNCQDLGVDLVETSWHLGARPEHEEWQGKIFSLSGKSDKYPPFSVCRYGEIDGICGINCRHSVMPYFEEVGQSTQKRKPTAEENIKAYDLQQKQRRYERNIRNYKYQQQALLSAGHQNEASIVQAHLNQTSKDYKQFLTENNLTRMTLNERVTGYHATSTKK